MEETKPILFLLREHKTFSFEFPFLLPKYYALDDEEEEGRQAHMDVGIEASDRGLLLSSPN